MSEVRDFAPGAAVETAGGVGGGIQDGARAGHHVGDQVAVIIADNAPGNPPPALGGADATITIPAMRISQGAGVTFKANLPAQVSFVIDPTKLQGADDQGRPRLFMPNPVQGGSSGSHYDTAAAPNLLMEPAINDSLYSAANLDITPHLLADIGWQINAVGVFPVAPGNAKVGSPSASE